MDVNHLVQTVAIYALPVLFAITLHEAAHGYVARHFGDLTAHAQGRISLNPARHIDWIGTFAVPLGILLATGGKFLFGWAKPVPVNYSALRKPRQHMAWVAAAGPAANLLMAVFWALVLRAAIVLNDQGPLWEQLASVHGASGVVYAVLEAGQDAGDYLVGVAAAGILVNLVLMLLNLLPIPPLDGSKILYSVLPASSHGALAALEQYSFIILIGLMYFGVIGAIIAPIQRLVMILLLS